MKRILISLSVISLLFFAIAPGALAKKPKKPKAEVEIRWKVKNTDILVYESTDPDIPNFMLNHSGIKDGREIDFFTNVQKLDKEVQYKLESLLYLPGAKVLEGMSWSYTNSIKGKSDYKFDSVEEYAGKKTAKIMAIIRSGRRAPPLAVQIFYDEDAKKIVAIEYRTSKKQAEPYKLTLLPLDEGKALDDKIQKAIDSGIEYLKSKQVMGRNITSPWPAWFDVSGRMALGETSVALLALLKSGVAPEDPAITGGFEWAKSQVTDWVYSASVFVMALEARYTPRDEIINSNKRRIEKPFKVVHRKLPKKDHERMRRIVLFLLGAPARPKIVPIQIGKDEYGELIDFDGNCVWDYTMGSRNPNAKDGFDNSNTQYAVLGLMAAQRCGIYCKDTVWARIAKHFVDTQQEEGPAVHLKLDPVGEEETAPKTKRVIGRGWLYRHDKMPPQGPDRVPYEAVASDTMTTVGVSCLAIARAAAGKALDRHTKKKIEEGIESGLGWLQKFYDADFNPYYLYGLERVGVLLGRKIVGGCDWYRRHAAALVALQSADGAWRGLSKYGNCYIVHYSDVVDTALILLFLKKATTPVITE